VLHEHIDFHVAVGGAAVGTADGRDVFVVATDGDFDVAGVGEGVVGGIEADPADDRQEDLGPGVGCLGTDEVVPGAVVEVTGGVAGGDACRAGGNGRIFSKA